MAEIQWVKKDRAQSLMETRRAKMDDLFKGRKYTIAKEIHLEGEQRFVTPFGNKGRHGFALVEDANPSNKFIIGATMLGQIARDYQAVELPAKQRKRRTTEQKAADDARLAEERAARKAARESSRARTKPEGAQAEPAQPVLLAEQSLGDDTLVSSSP